MQFIVVNNLSCEMIIGENSLGPSKLQAVIDLDERKVTFRRLGVTVKLATDSSANDRDIFAIDVTAMTLQPGEAAETAVRLATGVPDGSTLVLNHCPSSTMHRQWEIQGNPEAVHRQHMVATVVNRTDEEIMIQPHTVLMVGVGSPNEDEWKRVNRILAMLGREQPRAATAREGDGPDSDDAGDFSAKRQRREAELQERAMVQAVKWAELGTTSDDEEDTSPTESDSGKAVDECKINPGISDQQRQELKELLAQFEEIFEEGKQWKFTMQTEHEIRTGKNKPIRQQFYRVTPEKQQIIDEEVKKLLDAGVIERAESAWSSPVVIVKKPKGWRLCIDYRKLNEITERAVWPMPPIPDILAMLGGCGWFTALDISQGYHRIRIRKEDRDKTAFIVPGHCGGALYQYKYMPFGLTNAPSTFQRFMGEVLNGTQEFCTVYIDDIIIFSKSWQDHIEHLRCVFKKLLRANLVVRAPKSQLACTELDYLGHRITRECITPLEKNVTAT